MRNKRGQFYLIAAIIIVTLIAGFITVSNYTKKKVPVKIYDLGEELKIESQNVLEYGSAMEDEELNNLLEQFAEDYVNYAGGDKNFYFIFGDSTSVIVKVYQEFSEIVLVDGSVLTIINGGGEGTYTTGTEVITTIDGVEYPFNLGTEKSFYFVISQAIRGEKYIVTG
jgi:hypothetical protein